MKALSVLIKPVSGNCNMRCGYCFYADVAVNRQTPNLGIMTLDILETIVKKALSKTTGSCAFGFQGGEPTLAGLDFYRALVEFERKHNVNRVEILHTIQTNGLLIDERWAQFLAENRFLVGLSIDANKSVHDDLRLDIHGKGTHNRCIKTAGILAKNKVEFNVLSVVTHQFAMHPDKAYHFFKQNGFRHIQLIPCLDGLEEEQGRHLFSLDSKSYGSFLKRFFDLWYEDFISGNYISVRAFDNYIYMLGGHPPENCAMGGHCDAYPLVEADGSVYPCDFYALDEFLLGKIQTNTFEEMLSGETVKRFTDPARNTHEKCRVCEYFAVCRGGCRRNREPIIDGIPSLNYLCEAYRVFFSHSLDRMKILAKRLFD